MRMGSICTGTSIKSGMDVGGKKSEQERFRLGLVPLIKIDVDIEHTNDCDLIHLFIH